MYAVCMRTGSGLGYDYSCLEHLLSVQVVFCVVHVWYRHGTGVVQAWYRRGTGVVPVIHAFLKN